jgi:hypothetical protein
MSRVHENPYKNRRFIAQRSVHPVVFRGWRSFLSESRLPHARMPYCSGVHQLAARKNDAMNDHSIILVAVSVHPLPSCPASPRLRPT